MGVPIECTGQRFNYSLAKAAYLGKPGLDLANDLGVNVTDDVLFVVFSTPKLLMEGQLGDPTAYSALCIYSLKSIETMFTWGNIKGCFNGEGTTGLEFIRPIQQCMKTKHYPVDEAFCGLDINSPLEGELPIATEPALTLGSTGNGPISSIATTVSHKNFTLAFLGTGGGYLQKVLIESEKSGFKYDSNIALAPHCPDYGTCHRSQLLLDAKEDNLYMMTDRAVAKWEYRRMTALFIRIATNASGRATHSVAGTGVTTTKPTLMKRESGISWRTQITGMLTRATQILAERCFFSLSDQLNTIIAFRNQLNTFQRHIR